MKNNEPLNLEKEIAELKESVAFLEKTLIALLCVVFVWVVLTLIALFG